jgi:hypothetical protein
MIGGNAGCAERCLSGVGGARGKPTAMHGALVLPHFKDRWKVRLEQLELWMVSYRIDIE